MFMKKHMHFEKKHSDDAAIKKENSPRLNAKIRSLIQAKEEKMDLTKNKRLKSKKK